jgi:hypothetical protein
MLLTMLGAFSLLLVIANAVYFTQNRAAQNEVTTAGSSYSRASCPKGPTVTW